MMDRLQRLIATRRTLEILAAGTSIQICMAIGDRNGAERYLREQNTLIAARFVHMEWLADQGHSYSEIADEMKAMQAEARKAVM
ncbi:hypothetical protein ACQ858_08320 [Variovorax ureilyticus]|uniref:hypothetical protein n=1 Tax=Variovorax ureilyticus TaxID=1836198 RepID=UPI003D667A86